MYGRLVAITNGNAQTDDIPCLKDLFEFCVLAEQVTSASTPHTPLLALLWFLRDEAVRQRSNLVSVDSESTCHEEQTRAPHSVVIGTVRYKVHLFFCCCETKHVAGQCTATVLRFSCFFWRSASFRASRVSMIVVF